MTQLLQPTVPLLTSLPATPVDGQLICFQPTGGPVQLRRYNAAGVRWDIEGGLTPRLTNVTTTAAPGEFVIGTGSAGYNITAPPLVAGARFGVMNMASNAFPVNSGSSGNFYVMGRLAGTSFSMPAARYGSTVGGSVEFVCDGSNWYAVSSSLSPGYYSYSAYRMGAHNQANAGSGYVNLFQDTTERDLAGCGSASGYTVPLQGRYLVMGQVRYSTVVALAAIAVYKNGAIYRECEVSGAAGAGVMAQAVVTAAVGDVLAIFLYYGGAGAAINAGTAVDDWIQVEMLP